MHCYSIEVQTGEVVDQLPLTPSRDLTRVLQGYGTGSFSLPLADPACPAEWVQRTLPGRHMIVSCADAPGEPIVWAGYITQRTRSLEPVVTLDTATLEHYLLRRYVPNLSFKQVDQALILRRLAELAGGTEGISLSYDTPLTGKLRDRNYASDENARAYQRMQELANVIDGATWTIDVEWEQPGRRVRKTFRTGTPMIGDQSASPEAIFDLPGAITGQISFEERWGEGQAATHVVAVGDGEGDSKLFSSPVIDTTYEDMGWPRLEEREMYSGVKEVATIESHARADAAALFRGQQLLVFEARLDDGPVPWELTLGQTTRVVSEVPHLELDEVFHLTGYALNFSSQTWKPELARLGA